MKAANSPIVFLLGTNVILWGLAFSANPLQSYLARFSPPPQGLPQVPLLHAGLPDSDPHVDSAASPMTAVPAVPSPVPMGLDISSMKGSPESPATRSRVSDDASSSASVQPGPSPLRQVSISAASRLAPAVVSHTDTFFTQLSKADGLGGEVTLKTLDEPLMPIAAKAERLQQQRSQDRLSALPRHWREPLRQELASRPSVSKVTTVRLPVKDLDQRHEVPVIIDENGRAEGFSQPADAKAKAAVENWMSRQKPAESGTVAVMVVTAEPLLTNDAAPGRRVSFHDGPSETSSYATQDR